MPSSADAVGVATLVNMRGGPCALRLCLSRFFTKTLHKGHFPDLSDDARSTVIEEGMTVMPCIAWRCASKLLT